MTDRDHRILGRVLVAANLLLLAAGVASQLVKYIFRHDYAHGLVPLFDLNAEANLPTWYSSMLLFAGALAAGWIARARWTAGDAFRLQWAALAGVLLFFSAEEVAGLHEQISAALQAALGLGGLLFYAWVIPGLLAVIVLGAFFFRFFRQFNPSFRRGLILGAALYFGGALGVEMLGGALESAQGTRDTLAYALLAAVEEGLEMFGAVVVLRSLLRFAGGDYDNRA